jgi:hypothetical protein
MTPKIYTTSDLVLASVLHCNHCILDNFEQKFGKGQWTFEESPELVALVNEFMGGQLSVPVLRYKSAERELRRMIIPLKRI